MTDRSILDAKMSEADWLTQVVDYAHLRGWLVHHQRPARTANGWKSAIVGDVGFPDLVMVRDRRLVIAELKSESGRLRPEQEIWLRALCDVPEIGSRLTVTIWRPGDWESVREVLR